VLAALRRAGVRIPTLCAMENLLPSGACRLCVVEVEGQRNLVPACAFPVTPGMKIKTHTPRAVKARKTIIELLLADHPDDCLYCARNNNCDLQRLAQEHGVRARRIHGEKIRRPLDASSPSLVRDPDKCVLCGRCVRVCEEVQAVSAIDFVGRGSKTHIGTAFDEGLNVSSCIHCGQCVHVCPTGALTEQSHVEDVIQAIAAGDKHVVVQHAPAVSVTIGEMFGLKSGADVAGVLTAALRRIGFAKVFDTSFAADLTVMEEASELAERLTKGGALPMMTSCSPGWVKFVEQFYPKLIPNLSTCKSPQQMMGAVIKAFYAKQAGIDPHKVFSVSIMPCTAKKFEVSRPEHSRDGVADVDAVLTTRELAQLIKMHGINLKELTPEGADTPFGERSSAGKLFGATGGVMEAALRTAHFLVTGKELDANFKPTAIRGLNGIKEAKVKVGDKELTVAVASGLKNARTVLDQMLSGERHVDFLEVMTCPGGCIAGGGQPLGVPLEAIRERMQALYTIDKEDTLRTAHQNPSIQKLYKDFLGKPLGEKSHHLLHTHYEVRDVA